MFTSINNNNNNNLIRIASVCAKKTSVALEKMAIITVPKMLPVYFGNNCQFFLLQIIINIIFERIVPDDF